MERWVVIESSKGRRFYAVKLDGEILQTFTRREQARLFASAVCDALSCTGLDWRTV